MRIVCLAALVLLPMRLARVKSSAAWHTAYTVLLVAMLAMPLATQWLPALPLPILEAVPPPIAEHAPELMETAPVTVAPASPVTGAAPVATAPTQSPAAPAFEFRLIHLYLAVTLLLLFRLGLAWLRTRRLLLATTPGPSGTRVSDRITVPVTVGLFRPVIILPVDWTRWDAETLTTALTHEHAHARRRDPLVLLLAAINKALFWFHPLAWWIERRLTALAEEVADEACLNQFGDHRRYAAILLEMARAVSANRGRLAVAMARSPRVSRRINRILAWNGTRHWTRSRLTALVAAALALALVTATCQFVARTGGGDTAIEGQVLDSESNAPIAGGQVTLEPTRLPFADGSWDPLETETDDDGSFAFNVTGPVTYKLTAAHQNYVNPDPPWKSDAPSFEADEGAQPARTLLRLDPGYVVRGRVTAAVSGEPVPDVDVVALFPEAGAANGLDATDPVKEATTGPDGRYEIRGLAAGDYRIEARRPLNPILETAAPGGIFRPVSLSGQRVGFVASAADDVAVPPNPTVVTELDLSAQPMPNSEIRGRIRVGEEIGPDAVRLSLMRRSGPSFVVSDGILVGNEYRISGLAPGEYWISAMVASEGPSQGRSQIAEIVLSETPLDQDLVIARGGRIDGRVVVEGGDIEDGWEVALTVRRGLAGVTLIGLRRKLTEGDGTFSLSGVFADRYSVSVRNAHGFQVARVRLDGRTIAGSQFEIPPGVANHELEVFLEPETGIAARQAE